MVTVGWGSGGAQRAGSGYFRSGQVSFNVPYYFCIDDIYTILVRTILTSVPYHLYIPL